MELGKEAKLAIEVFDVEWPNHRAEYVARLAERISGKDEGRTIVFLDPDTDLGKPDRKHVTLAEVRRIYDSMRPNDLLVLYQHDNPAKTLVPKKEAELREALDVREDAATMIQSDISKDVALLAAVRADECKNES